MVRETLPSTTCQRKEEAIVEIFALPSLLMRLNGLSAVVQLVLMILGIACCIKYLRSR